MDDDKLNISGFSSINPTFPKNDIFADYIIYNPENGNGTLDLSIGKDLHDELQIEPNFDCSYFDNENGKKEINQNGISNKSIFKQIPQKEIQKQILNVNKTPKIKEIKPQDYIVYENKQKKIFETYNENEKEIQKQKKLLMNRLSAKKSRLKKKVYIKCLEDELEKMKNEVEQKRNFEKFYLSGISGQENGKGIEIISSDVQRYNILIKQENNLLEKSKNDSDSMNEYINLQKQLLHDILIKIIEVSMPIKCKIFQHKYLKLQKFDNDDSLEVIINKINGNIEMLKELYDFDKQIKSSKKSKSESMAYQLFNYYDNLKNYVTSFKIMYEAIM
jgi:hypothetical protein